MYKLSKSIKTTQIENGLIITESDKKTLFDFTLLENEIKDITILEDIKKQCFKNISITNKSTYISKSANAYTNFEHFNGMVYFKPYAIYGTNGKRLFVILKIIGIDIAIMNRQNIYAEYEITEKIQTKIESSTESIDIEVA